MVQSGAGPLNSGHWTPGYGSYEVGVPAAPSLSLFNDINKSSSLFTNSLPGYYVPSPAANSGNKQK